MGGRSKEEEEEKGKSREVLTWRWIQCSGPEENVYTGPPWGKLTSQYFLSCGNGEQEGKQPGGKMRCSAAGCWSSHPQRPLSCIHICCHQAGFDRGSNSANGRGVTGQQGQARSLGIPLRALMYQKNEKSSRHSLEMIEWFFEPLRDPAWCCSIQNSTQYLPNCLKLVMDLQNFQLLKSD